MELYKLKDNKLVKFNGGFVVYDNRIYTNPTEEIIRKAGYKDLVYDAQPEYDETTHYLVREFEEQDNRIVIHWRMEEIVIEEELEVV